MATTYSFVKKSGAPPGALTITTAQGAFVIDDASSSVISTVDPLAATALSHSGYLTLQSAATGPVAAPPAIANVFTVDGVVAQGSKSAPTALSVGSGVSYVPAWTGNAAIDTTTVGVVFAARRAAGGGNIVLPAGASPAMTAPLPAPLSAPWVIVDGAGQENTILNFAELGAGQYAIPPTTVSGSNNVFRNFSVVGPSTGGNTRGPTPPSACFGIGLGTKTVYENVRVSGFLGGFVPWGNHVTAYRCTAIANKFGVYGVFGQPSSGNIDFIECDLSSNNYATFGIAPNGHFDGNRAPFSHGGFSPYFGYKEKGATTTLTSGTSAGATVLPVASTTDFQVSQTITIGTDTAMIASIQAGVSLTLVAPGLTNSHSSSTSLTTGGTNSSILTGNDFSTTAIEAIGNCAIFDANTGTRSNWVRGNQFSLMTRDATYKYASDGLRGALDVGIIQENVFDFGADVNEDLPQMAFGTSGLLCCDNFAQNNTIKNCDTLITWAANNGALPIWDNLGTANIDVTNVGDGPSASYTVRYHSITIAKGTVVHTNGGNAVTKADNTKEIVGVAAESRSGGQHGLVMVGRGTISVTVNAAVTDGQILAPDASSAGRVKPVAVSTDRVAGIAQGAQATPGSTVSMLVQPAVPPAADTGRMKALIFTAKSANYTAVDGDAVLMTGAHTLTLPSPATANQRVYVESVNGTGAAPCTISTPSGAIVGLGVASAATSILLGAPGSYVVMQSDGTNWNVVDGCQDSGWLAFALLNSWTNTSGPISGTTAAYRLIGNVFKLGGSVQNGSTTTINTAVAAAYRPKYAVNAPVHTSSGQQSPLSMSTAGVLTAPLISAVINLDPLSYTVD